MEDFTYMNLKKLHDAKQEREDLIDESLKNACDAIYRLGKFDFDYAITYLIECRDGL